MTESAPQLTSIRKHPKVVDYFHHLPFLDPLTHRDSLGDLIVSWYEKGDVIIFDKPWLKLDLEFLRSLPVLETAEMYLKKAKPKALLLPLNAESFPEHILGKMFPGDLEKAHRYQEQILTVTEQICRFVDYTFPGYKIIDRDRYSWRFAMTENEGLHWDSYGLEPDDSSSVRVFVNLDDQPRVWEVSHKVETVIEAYKVKKNLRRHKDMHPNLLNAQLNLDLPLKKLPRHRVEFAPLSMWLVNSQIVGHEIVYGRKMLAYTFRVDPSTLRNPENDFVKRVRRAMI